MKKRLFACIFILSFSMTAVVAQKNILIEGKVTAIRDGDTKIYYYGNGKSLDSAIIKHNRFEFNFPFEQPCNILICDEHSYKTNDHPYWFRMIADRPGTISLKDVDLSKEISVGEVTGLKAAQKYQEFRRQYIDTRNEIKLLITQRFGDETPKNGSPRSGEYLKFRDSLNKARFYSLIKNFIQKNPESYASTFALNKEGVELIYSRKGEGEILYNMLSQSQKNTNTGKSMNAVFMGLKNDKIGQQVKDFTLYNPEGKAIKFNSLKGKYVMLDFWSSTCIPCIASFPHLTDLYSKYKSDSFEIVGISTDKFRRDWLKSVEKYQNPWPQLLDTENIAHSRFAVSGLPVTFLIDPQGKILVKEDGYDPKGISTVEKKIMELFGTK